MIIASFQPYINLALSWLVATVFLYCNGQYVIFQSFGLDNGNPFLTLCSHLILYRRACLQSYFQGLLFRRQIEFLLRYYDAAHRFLGDEDGFSVVRILLAHLYLAISWFITGIGGNLQNDLLLFQSLGLHM